MRAWLPAVAAILLSLLSISALAQVNPASGEVGFIGIPEFTSTETGIPFFSADAAKSVDDGYMKMRNAIVKCDRKAYDDAKRGTGQYGGAHNPTVLLPLQAARMNRDIDSAREAQSKAPPFPEPCDPPSHQGGDRFHPYSLALLGGGSIPLNGNTYTTGVDTFTPGNFLIDNRSSSNAGAPTGMAGMRAQFAVSLIPQAMTTERKKSGFFMSGIFFETGVQTGFGANSLIQSFQNVNTTPQGSGQQTVRENVQVPLLVGLSISLTDGTSVIPPSVLHVYGGVTLDSWTHTISGREAGAPAGPGFNAVNNRFTVDPTVGVGWRSSMGRSVAGNFWIGFNTEFQFRPGSVVQAPSANFPSETYYGTVDPHTSLLVLGQIGFSFGGR
jgi:hypothetical protein